MERWWKGIGKVVKGYWEGGEGVVGMKKGSYLPLGAGVKGEH